MFEMEESLFNFKNKTVIVTGGTRGIGLETSMLFHKYGADVVASYVSNDEAAFSLKERCVGLEIYKGDLSNVADAKNLVDFSKDVFGRIDILINNAGIWDYLAAGSFLVDVWDNIIKTNLRSMYLISDCTIAYWLENGIKGKIVNVASTAGQRGEAEHAHYAATKGAMIAYTKSLSSELAPKGILTNCVAPGWVDTEMNIEVFANGGKERISAGIPLGRVPTAIEIAKPIVFMASDMASAISGEILNVNGGSVLCG